MKTIKFILTILLFALMGQAATSLAEDTDIYGGLGGAAGVPNIMIIIDNAANSNASMSACTYWDGVSPQGTNTGNKSLDNYMCALDTIAHGLATKADGSAVVNLGITTQAGVYLTLTPVSDAVYTGAYSHTAGQTNRQVLSAAIRALRDVPGNATQGTSFQETWAYYTGGNGGTTNVGIISGTTYAGTNAATGCQKNFAIFISGVTNSAHANTNGNELTKLTAVLNNAVTAGTLTAAQRTAMLTLVSTGESPYAVEWARLMKTLDINTSVAGTGTQSITTYSVAAGSPVYPAAMDSMEKYIYSTALYGGGKYYAATSYASIYQSILKILNEVQAVNSVFSASSLPVSVNAQGTYLNQIYMGMFRPDETGAPRWLGNMKQYSFIATRDPTTHLIGLSLGDSLGAEAISSGGTGFISPNAVSYWTCGGSPQVRACSPVADPAAGFWAKNIQGTGGAFDLPDGELVEKGGAAQIMRLANLTADYTTAAGLATNPRKLYTYCPSGASCDSDLTASANAFSTANADITAAAFGASTSLIVSSIARTGATALVTTAETHNFADGASVTISGATQSEYNVTQAINFANPHSATTFTITGLPDYPTTPSTGAYTASLHNSTTKAITGVSVATSTTANANACTSGTIPNINCVRVTVTSAAHGYANTNNVVIAGVSPAQYSGTFTIANVTADTFTYDVPVTPTSPSVNAYSVKLPAPAAKTITIHKTTGPGGGCTVTSSSHGYSNGNSVTISGANPTVFNATWTVSSAATNSFQINTTGNDCNVDSTSGQVVLNTPTISIAAGNISRASATATTATAVAASAVTHNTTYTLAYVSGSGSSESQYAASGGSRSVVATCSSGATCTTFTFPLDNTVFSTTLTTSSPTVALTGATVAIPAGQITRSGTTATVSGVAGFVAGNFIDIGVSGASVGTESAYLSPANGWEILTCNVGGCGTSFTFGPVTLSPTTPATTGSSLRAYQGSTPPAKDPLIKWVRGEDNYGDENSLCPPGSTAGLLGCPNPKVTVRPSFHGDVLHSRPVAINYGGTTGVVVFYGANDGVYRAVNGNQTNPSGSALPVPGSELWGFIPSEFFGKLNRQRTNSPVLEMPSTPAGIAPTPEKKDYFADGSTSVYQLMNADGTTNTAYIYLAMRRGGDFIYALNVSNPTSPAFLWKIEPSGITTPSGFTASSDFAELGQTWSAPKVALIKGYNDGSGHAKPVMIFGAGYSTTQDTEPATSDTKGRGIYIVDAATGALVWRATYGASSACSAVGEPLPATCTVSGMNYSIPADITLMDRDNDGYIDRLYAVDVGGNVWRVDLQREGNTVHNTPDYWKVNQVASLGGGGTPLRKFFFPPDVVPTSTFDAVIAGSGDREHPLSSTATLDRIFVLKDLPGNDGSALTTIVEGALFDASSVAYDKNANGTTSGAINKGYFKNLLTGEKVVNAPLTVAGYTYLGTNQPSSADSCSANLGIAKGYRLNPLTGAITYTQYDGGGLPPSPVAGVVAVTVTGEATSSLVAFCIGCGGDTSCVGAGCDSALGGAKPAISVPTSRRRTYWYREGD
jgi:Tfp pilus tip-associated adhesin PilY1